MRVIAGKAKGRRLKSLNNTSTRPTQDRIKESIFNMIAPYLHMKKGLDLFAGFGGLGLEALSRGTDFVTFLEKDYRNYKVIKENIAICGFEEQSQVKKEDVFSYLEKTNSQFDLIFMDPPYKKGMVHRAIDLIEKMNLLNKQGLVIIEHEKEISIKPEKLQVIKTRYYGDTGVTILESRGGKT